MFNRTQFTVLAVLLALLASMISSLTSAQAAPALKPNAEPTAYQFTYVGETLNGWTSDRAAIQVSLQAAGDANNTGSQRTARYFQYSGAATGAVWAKDASSWYPIANGVYVLALNYGQEGESFWLSYDPAYAPAAPVAPQPEPAAPQKHYLHTVVELQEFWSPGYNPVILENGDAAFLPADRDFEVIDAQGSWVRVVADGGGTPWVDTAKNHK